MSDEPEKQDESSRKPERREGSVANDDTSPESEGSANDPMRALLKRSLSKEAPAPNKPILREVQRKIRQRSKGKFFSDGWSTTAAKVNYALVAVLMLLIVAVAYFALGPMGFSK